jgi:hypothetical protein
MEIPPKNGIDGPFAESARRLRDLGYSPIAIVPGTKKPASRGWSRACIEPLDAETIERFKRSSIRYGVALACGFNGLVIVDRDTEEHAHLEALAPVMPRSPLRRFGKKGCCSAFRDQTGDIKSLQIKGRDGRVLIDVLAGGRAAVWAPSIHPEGGRYREIGERRLSETPTAELPVITTTDIERIITALRPWMSPPRPVPALPPVPIRHPELGPALIRRHAAYAIATLKARAAELARMGPRTGRNRFVFETVCAIGKYVHAGLLPQPELESAVLEACALNQLLAENGPGDIRRTIAKGLACAANDPLPQLQERAR